VLILVRFGGFAFREALDLTWDQAVVWSLEALEMERRFNGGYGA
jgi:hypothetical protein